MKKLLFAASVGLCVLVGSFFASSDNAEAQMKPSRVVNNFVVHIIDQTPHQLKGTYCSVTVWYNGSGDCIEVGGSNWDGGVSGAPIGSCASKISNSAGFKAADGAVWYRSQAATPDAGKDLNGVYFSNCN